MKINTTYQNILEEFSKYYTQFIRTEEANTFGPWVQTLSDLYLLKLELTGLCHDFEIDPYDRFVEFDGDEVEIRNKIGHLETVANVKSVYAQFISEFNSYNAYAFHGIYPYKGKFYPRLVRSLINYSNVPKNGIIFDPFNGSGTLTHEANLMGYDAIGSDINPISNIIASAKSFLLEDFNLLQDLMNAKKYLDNFKKTEKFIENDKLNVILSLLYIDSVDAKKRSSFYKNKRIIEIFTSKINSLKKKIDLVNKIISNNNLQIGESKIILNNIVKNELPFEVDAVITSPPYLFSLDYSLRNKFAFEMLNYNLNKTRSSELGKNSSIEKNDFGSLNYTQIQYFIDLENSLMHIVTMLKTGCFLAIVISDSLYKGKKVPTTKILKNFLINMGLELKHIIINPNLGQNNQSIRGDNILIFEK